MVLAGDVVLTGRPPCLPDAPPQLAVASAPLAPAPFLSRLPLPLPLPRIHLLLVASACPPVDSHSRAPSLVAHSPSHPPTRSHARPCSPVPLCFLIMFAALGFCCRLVTAWPWKWGRLDPWRALSRSNTTSTIDVQGVTRSGHHSKRRNRRPLNAGQDAHGGMRASRKSCSSGAHDAWHARLPNA